MPSTYYPSIALSDLRLDNLALINTNIDRIWLELVNSKSIADLLVQDSGATPRYFVRQEVYNDTSGTTTVNILNLDGSIPSPAPVLPLLPVKAASSLTIDENIYSVAVAGTGYAVGETLSNIRLFDATGAISANVWYNLSANTTIAAPVFANLRSGDRATQSTITTVAQSATSAVVLPANGLRKGAILVNRSTEIFYGAYGPTASTTAYTFSLAPLTATPIVPPGLASSHVISDNMTMQISGLWAAAGPGSLMITELT